MFRIIFKVILIIVLCALCITAVLQAFTNIYDFSPARQFSGETIYNPYNGVVDSDWKKANFHAHQRYIVGGIDFEYTAEEFVAAYKAKNYDIIGLADHQRINPFGHLPAYEHGLGLNNYHLLMLGATDVSWFYYPIMTLPQHQMQYQLDKFKPQVKVLGMNHASRHRHVGAEVFNNLMGYDLMEMNPDLSSIAWDIALSSGIYSTLIANDDAHSISDRGRWFQRCFTMVNTPSLNADDIFASLKAGRAYGLSIPIAQNMKPAPHKGLPSLKKVVLVQDTVTVMFSSAADSIKFIGQDGVVLKCEVRADSTSYKFLQSDTYVRVDAYFPQDVRIWLNPFYRTGGAVREPATVDRVLTVVNMVVWGIVSLILFLLIIMTIRRRRHKGSQNYYGHR